MAAHAWQREPQTLGEVPAFQRRPQSMFSSSLNNPRRTMCSTILVLAPLLLICTYVAADDLPSEISTLLKAELEKEFGPLNGQIMADDKQMWGRVISIDYELPGGKRLDDTWGDKVVTALDRLGITAEYDGGEVRADQQSIAGREASSIQFTTAGSDDDPDVIAFTAMFTPGS